MGSCYSSCPTSTVTTVLVEVRGHGLDTLHWALPLAQRNSGVELAFSLAPTSHTQVYGESEKHTEGTSMAEPTLPP